MCERLSLVVKQLMKINPCTYFAMVPLLVFITNDWFKCLFPYSFFFPISRVHQTDLWDCQAWKSKPCLPMALLFYLKMIWVWRMETLTFQFMFDQPSLDGCHLWLLFFTCKYGIWTLNSSVIECSFFKPNLLSFKLESEPLYLYSCNTSPQPWFFERLFLGFFIEVFFYF